MNRFVIEDELDVTQWAFIRCVHRGGYLSNLETRIQRVGIDSGAGIRHLHAVSVVYGVRLGRFATCMCGSRNNPKLVSS